MLKRILQILKLKKKCKTIFKQISKLNFGRYMVITTGNDIEGGKVVQYLGVVRGIVVRATSIGAGFGGGRFDRDAKLSEANPNPSSQTGVRIAPTQAEIKTDELK